jgi:hypothetical protein
MHWRLNPDGASIALRYGAGTVTKAPGPFHETAEGKHPERKPKVDPAQYLPHLTRLRAFEVRGKADFPRAIELIEAILDDL